MKIAIISNVAVSKRRSGKAKELTNIAKFLAGPRTEICIFSLSDADRRIDAEDYTEYEIREPSYGVPKAAARIFNAAALLVSGKWTTTEIMNKNRKLIRKLKEFNPDIIISGTFMLSGAIREFMPNAGMAGTKKASVISAFDSWEVINSFLSQLDLADQRPKLAMALPLRRFVARRYFDYNISLYERMLAISDIIALPTDSDVKSVRRRFPKYGKKCITLNAQFFDGRKQRSTAPLHNGITKILFIGSCLHRPNTNAIERIRRDIAPRLPAKEFIIAGKGCKAHSYGNVRILGEVEDIERVLSSADICIAPITEGTGIKVKVMDYISHGKAVIGTRMAFDGYNAMNRINAIVEDDIGMFAQRITELEGNRRLYASIQRNARTMLRDFSYNAVRLRWRKAVRSLPLWRGR
jgi:glycosyltransferase involved in cell wall biosynthesis